MRNKFLTIGLLFILIFSSTVTSSEILSEGEENDDAFPNIDEQILQSTGDSGSTSFGLLRALFEKFLDFRFRIGTAMMGTRYFNFQLFEPVSVRSYPEAVDIEYLNETTIEIGAKNPENPDEWRLLLNTINGYDWGWIYNSVSFRFELLLPENISQDALTYRFDPEIVSISPNTKNLDWKGIDEVLKTNLTLELKPSGDSTNPTQDMILKVKVIRIDVSNPRNMRFAPEFANFRNLPKNKDKLNIWSAGFRLQWNTFMGFYFMLLNSGLPDIDEKVDSIVNILVRIKKDHFAELIPPKPIDIHPNEVLSIPVEVKNLGSHIDTFNFRVNVSDDSLKVGQPSALTMEPGETRNAYVTVSAPPVLYDQGKTTSIVIEVFSIDNPELIFSNKIVLTTQGVYVSGGYAYYLMLAGIILLILIALIIVPMRKRRVKICVKPQKPWEIPEEKEYLKKLKDKKEYNKVFNMMNEEYQSALLWYKHYRKEMLAKYHKKISLREFSKQAIKKITSFFKMPKKIMKKKDIKKSLIKLKPEVKKVPKPKEIPSAKTAEIEQKAMIDINAQQEKLRREKLLLKIKRKQEKQRRKFKQSI